MTSQKRFFHLLSLGSNSVRASRALVIVPPAAPAADHTQDRPSDASRCRAPPSPTGCTRCSTSPARASGTARTVRCITSTTRRVGRRRGPKTAGRARRNAPSLDARAEDVRDERRPDDFLRVDDVRLEASVGILATFDANRRPSGGVDEAASVGPVRAFFFCGAPTNEWIVREAFFDALLDPT